MEVSNSELRPHAGNSSYTVTMFDVNGNQVSQTSFAESQLHGLSAISFLKNLVGADRPIIDAGGKAVITSG